MTTSHRPTPRPARRWAVNPQDSLVAELAQVKATLNSELSAAEAMIRTLEAQNAELDAAASRVLNQLKHEHPNDEAFADLRAALAKVAA